MTTTVVYSGTADGYIQSADDVSYANARAGSGYFLEAITNSASVYVGQNLFLGYEHSVYEIFLGFDTSAVGTDTISAAVLNVTSNADQSATDFTIEARLDDWGTTLTTADWVAGASLSGLTSLATKTTSSGFTAGTAYDFTDVALPANVNKTGTTRMLLCSSRTTGNNAPTGDEYVSIRSADYAGTTSDPKLTVTHAAGGGSSGTTALPGTAHQPGTQVAPAPVAASATGTAQTPTPSIHVPAGVASGTGTAHQPTVTVFTGTSAPAGVASGTGTAPDPLAAVAAMAPAASGTGSAPQPSVTTFTATDAPAGLAAGTGSAPAPVPSVGPAPDAAAGTGTAHQPTVTTSVQVNADAGLAAATGTAQTPAAQIRVPAGVATGTGTAHQIAALVEKLANAQAAAAIATAYAPVVSVVAYAGLASGTGSASDPSITSGAIVTTGGYPPSGSASHLVPDGSAVRLAPAGSATSLLPRGSATHPTPEV